MNSIEVQKFRSSAVLQFRSLKLLKRDSFWPTLRII